MNTIFYPRFFDRLKIYNLNLDDVNTKDIISKKYSYISCDINNDNVEFYKKTKKLAKGRNGELSNLLMSYLFIDKYYNKKTPLPIFEEKYYYLNYEHTKIAMEFLLEPMKTFDEAIALIKIADEKLLPLYEKLSESYREDSQNGGIGIELGKFLLIKKENDNYVNIYGNKMSAFGTNGRYIKKINNSEWEVYFMKDRSNELEYILTIYDEKCLCRYMLIYTVRSIR